MTLALTDRAPEAALAPRRRRARAGDLLLADALDREARAPQGRVAVVVRLSRLPPPGPRPYHRRVARALLEDAAQRHGGQVLMLASGDLVLLAPPPDERAPAGPEGMQALPDLVGRLLHADGEGAAPVAALLPLAGAADRLRALLDDPAPDLDDEEDDAPSGRPRNPFAGRLSPGFAALPPAILAAPTGGELAALLRVQTTARLPRRGTGADLGAIQPAHRAPAVDPALLAARLAPVTGAGEGTDPWLRQHLADAIGGGLLALLGAAWGTGGPLDAAPRPGVPPLLLRLPLAVLATDAFAAFAALPHADPRPSIAIGIAEAAADPAAWDRARDRLAEAGMSLVLDGLTHHTLVLARPEALRPDMFALPWTSSLPRLAPQRRTELAEAIARIGPARLLLTGADNEAALRWGRSEGLELFQGTHVEAMLAATRLLACPGPAGAGGGAHPCGLRGCAGRGAAATALGRAGCVRPSLLDRGIDPPGAARRVA